MTRIDRRKGPRNRVRTPRYEGWRDYGMCGVLRIDPERFFPARGMHATDSEVRAVLAICQACSVRQECLHDALQDDEQHGIRGGLTAVQRRKLLRSTTPTR